jgi:heat shock protein HslJ
MRTMTTLEGRRWRLVAWRAADGGRETVPPDVEATALFEDGSVTGRGGCNGFRAPYELTADRLSVGEIASTMMACAEPAMRVESAYHAGLARVAAARVADDALELLDAGGGIVLAFVRAAVTPLVGTGWTATGINNGRGGVVSLIEGTAVTATFHADGRITGSGGCNPYTGGYRIDGRAIAIGQVASTLRACLGPEGVMDQEAAFHAALGRATRWALDGARLDLRDDDGAVQVAFVAPSTSATAPG